MIFLTPWPGISAEERIGDFPVGFNATYWVPEMQHKPAPCVCPTAASGAYPGVDAPSERFLGETTKKKLFHPRSSCVVSCHQTDNLWRAEKLGLMSNEIGFSAEICYPREASGAVSGSPGPGVQQTALVS